QNQQMEVGNFTASDGTVNLTGTASVNVWNGNFISMGANNNANSGTINQNGGTVTLYSDAGVTPGGNGILYLGRAGTSGGTFTYNLNGGTLTVPQIQRNTANAANAVFNFNGGTLKAPKANATFLFGLTSANVLAGGAIIDSSSNNITISQALLDGGGGGGLTKNGNGTLTLTGPNTYSGATLVNAGELFVTPAHQVTGNVTVADGAKFGVTTATNVTTTVGALTLGSSGVTTLDFSLGFTGNPVVPVISCGQLAVNGSSTIRFSGTPTLGAFPLVQYTGTSSGAFVSSVIAPRGVVATVSNSVASSTIYVVVSSLGSGLVWTGTNSVSPNVWDLNTTTNWLINGVATTYLETLPPGDAVTFNDIGSGTVTLTNTASPASMVISNNSVNYTFQGAGHIAGTIGITKLGTGTATMGLSGSTYTGNTVISNGIYQLGSATAIPDGAGSGNVVISSAGKLDMAGFSETINGLSGTGLIDNSSGTASVLTLGNGDGAVTWAGTITNSGTGGNSIIKVGAGNTTITGTNYLRSAAASQINGGSLLITNGGALYMSGSAEFWVQQNAGTATVTVDGGTLITSNNWLVVGRNNAAATGTLIVNSGLVQKAGANNIVVGSLGATGYLYVNGGQVLNNGNLWLGENTGANAYLYLNGGLIQATQVRPNGTTPTTYIAYFNGGTLQATASSTNYLQVFCNVMSKGLVLDDNGFTLSIGGATLSDGDGMGGGLIKKGSGTVYLDIGNGYSGTTLVTNGTLAGVGSVAGPVVVAPAGNLGAGDAGAVGSFTINNDLTLQGKATLRVNKTGGSPVQDQVVVAGNINYGGILSVTNATSDATPLTTSDTFQLFNVSGTHTGNFSSIAGSPGAGLAYS
ncbi:MAG: autotransporter-associated beta strand repeat-containing protein, partial [Verrucomicrobia bacterium]|nr:autotransporter-associated beta strand repeat-containing protein [Verrucomicrobiota bacterium]